jgi:hypothetical protein
VIDLIIDHQTKLDFIALLSYNLKKRKVIGVRIVFLFFLVLSRPVVDMLTKEFIELEQELV